MVLVELPDTSGSLFVDGDQCWICGYGLETRLPPVVAPVSPFAADPTAVHELDVELAWVAEPTRLELPPGR